MSWRPVHGNRNLPWCLDKSTQLLKKTTCDNWKEEVNNINFYKLLCFICFEDKTSLSSEILCCFYAQYAFSLPILEYFQGKYVVEQQRYIFDPKTRRDSVLIPWTSCCTSNRFTASESEVCSKFVLSSCRSCSATRNSTSASMSDTSSTTSTI